MIAATQENARIVFAAINAGVAVGQEWATLADAVDQRIVRSPDYQASEAVAWVTRQEGLNAEQAVYAMRAFIFGVGEGLK